jgi:hypothetical protein
VLKRNLQAVTAGLFFLTLAGCNRAPLTTSADSVNKPVDELQPQPVPAPQPPTTTIPAGTKLRVSLIDAVNSDKNRAGDRFAASLAEPVVIDGKVILSKGTKVYGRVVEAKGSGRVKGRASVELQLTAIVLADRRSLDISTNTYTAVAPATKKRDAAIIGGGAGLGAAIGAIAGGGKGALIGAAVGGGAGTGTVLATKGKEIHYPPETRLQFTLASPIEI